MPLLHLLLLHTLTSFAIPFLSSMLIPTTIVLSFICWNGVDLYAFLRPPFFFNPNCYMLSPLLFVTIRIKSPSRIQRYVLSHVLACTSLFCSHRSDSRQLLTPSKKKIKRKIFLDICISASVVASFPLLVFLLWFENYIEASR